MPPVFHNRENKVHLINGREVWESRSVVTVSTVTHVPSAGRPVSILLVKRAPRTAQGGKWCLPCGFADYNETGFDSARREIWEEAKLDVSGPGWQSNPKPWDISTIPKTEKQSICLYYWFRFCGDSAPTPEEALDLEEITEIAWVDPLEAIQWDLAFDHFDIVSAMVFAPGSRAAF